MPDLTKKEIFDQLKKLGINSIPELNDYYKEYEKYSSTYSHKFIMRAARKKRSAWLQNKFVNSFLVPVEKLLK